jgi:hypothetical protein
MGGVSVPFTKEMLQTAYLSNNNKTDKKSSDTTTARASSGAGGKYMDVYASDQQENGGLVKWFPIEGEDELGRPSQGRLLLGFQFRQLAGDLRSVKR